MSVEAPSFAVDLTNCDREPIHTPGSIQPHGVLVALSEPDLTVLHASESAAAHLGRRAEEVLGKPLGDMLDCVAAERVRGALCGPKLDEVNPIDLRVRGARFDGILHRHDGVAILEIEPRAERVDERSAPLRLALAELQSADTLADLGPAVVRAVRRLSGFERVMLYRFDEDGHGSVDAESVAAGIEPYLGHHYPASDIPQQARALYLRNWLRIIPDARYTPSRIVPALRADTGAPLDLSFSVLRSVSPIHVEYMANMGVRASMSISLVVRGALWGLISCASHSAPRFVDYEVRLACESIGRLMSLQIAALEDRERAELRQARRSTLRALADAMRSTRGADDVLEGLLARPDALLSLVGAEGAAVVVGGSSAVCGRTPSGSILDDIARWLEAREDGESFVTSSLGASFPRAIDAKDVASGLLSIALPGSTRRVVWFRPERVHTVVWGGDPHKPVVTDPQLRIHPRRSFENWQEEVRLRARPWTPGDLEAAEELRRSAVEIDLGRQLERAQKAIRVRDDLVAVVSHDLRNPLNVIQMQATLWLRSTVSNEDEPARRLRATAERVQRAVDTMNALITDLLDLAKIEAGRFNLQLRREQIHELVDEALVILRPLAQAKQIEILEAHVDRCAADVDRERMFQVLSNLLGNAIKFTPEGGRITVETRRRSGEQWVAIADTGPGISDEMMRNVFDRYWQGPRAYRPTGAGLGLYIAKGIVEAHGGRIWVERAGSGGARFTFAIPCSDGAAA